MRGVCVCVCLFMCMHVSIHDVIMYICVIPVLYCRTLSDGVGAEETDGVTVVELEDEGGLVHTSPERSENGEKVQL